MISGYLITSIVVKELKNGDFSLLRFWDRRIRRILPAASVVLLVVSLFQYSLFFRPDLQQFVPQKISALFSFANIHFWSSTVDYWGSEADNSPFLHYWSLSLEEQYYLLFPPALILLFKFQRQALLALILVMVLVSFAAFSFGAHSYPEATFYLLPTRMWQLGIGCFLAIATSDKVPKENSLGTFAGIAIIGFVCLFPANRSGIGYESLAAVLGSCLVIVSGSNSVSSALLQNRLSVFIGQISYSLYLWHWPILFSLKAVRNYGYVASDLLLGILGIASLIALSLISYFCVERPFRKSSYGAPIALCIVAFLGVYFIAVEPRLIERHYESNYDTPTWYGKYYDLSPAGTRQDLDNIIGPIQTPERQASPSAYKEGGIIRLRSSEKPRIVLLGDSHGVMWSKMVDEVTEELDLSVSLWSMIGEPVYMSTPPVEQPGRFLNEIERFEYDDGRQLFLREWNPDIVIVATRWEYLDYDLATDLFRFLEQHAKNVILLESPPVLENVGNRNLYQYLSFLGLEPPDSPTESQIWESVDFEDSKASREKILRTANSHLNFYFLPTADLFATDQGVVVSKGRQILYLDDDHLIDDGAFLAEERLKAAIQLVLNGDTDQFPLVSIRGNNAEETLRQVELPND